MMPSLARVVTAIICVAFVSVAAPAAQEKAPPPTIVGKWNLALDTPHGRVTMDFALKLDGKKVTGTLTSEQMGEMPLTGEFTDGRLMFSVTNGTDELTFAAKLKDADTLVGNLVSHLGDMACMATRVKPR